MVVQVGPASCQAVVMLPCCKAAHVDLAAVPSGTPFWVSADKDLKSFIPCKAVEVPLWHQRCVVCGRCGVDVGGVITQPGWSMRSCRRLWHDGAAVGVAGCGCMPAAALMDIRGIVDMQLFAAVPGWQQLPQQFHSRGSQFPLIMQS